TGHAATIKPIAMMRMKVVMFGHRVWSSSSPHPCQQFWCRPGIGRQGVFYLHGAHGSAALQSQNAVGAADVVAHTGEHLLQFAVLVDRELRDVGSCALAHGWRAFEAGRVKGGGQ